MFIEEEGEEGGCEKEVFCWAVENSLVKSGVAGAAVLLESGGEGCFKREGSND